MRILTAVVMILLLPFMAHAGTGEDAVMALMKLEARCSVGINYRDLAPAVGEAKHAVNVFLGGDEAKRKPDLAESASKTLQHYVNASTLWSAKFRSGVKSVYVEIYPKSFFEEFVKRYPEIDNSDPADKKAIVQVKTSGQGKEIHVMQAVKYAMDRGAKELQVATSISKAAGARR